MKRAVSWTMLLVALAACTESVRAAVVRKRKVTTVIDLDLSKPNAVPVTGAEILLLEKALARPQLTVRKVITEDHRAGHIFNDGNGAMWITTFGSAEGEAHSVVTFDAEDGLAKLVIPIDARAVTLEQEKLPGGGPPLPKINTVEAYDFYHDDGKDFVTLKLANGKVEMEKRKLVAGIPGELIYTYKERREQPWPRIAEVTSFSKVRDAENKAKTKTLVIRYNGSFLTEEDDPPEVQELKGDSFVKSRSERRLMGIIEEVQAEMMSVVVAAEMPSFAWRSEQSAGAGRRRGN